MNDLTEDTAISVQEAKDRGLDVKEYYWPFNGMKPDGSLMGMTMAEWVAWAITMHPEYLDEETGAPLLYDFVFTQADEEILGVEGLAGTVMCTILPALDNVTKYWIVAQKAADRYPANPKIAERFRKLSELFLEKDM